MYQHRLGLQLLAAFLAALISSCSRSPTGPGQSTGNLIPNPSFEVNGKPSLQSWTVTPPLASVVQDAPPNDGTYALQVAPGWIPQTGYASTSVAGKSGIYRLTVWAKSVNGWQGYVVLGTTSGGQWLKQKYITVNPSQWTQYSVLDTVSVANHDSITVELSAGTTEVSNGEVRFDNVVLEEIQ